VGFVADRRGIRSGIFISVGSAFLMFFAVMLLMRLH
jgi:hypothetical protein